MGDLAKNTVARSLCRVGGVSTELIIRKVLQNQMTRVRRFSQLTDSQRNATVFPLYCGSLGSSLQGITSELFQRSSGLDPHAVVITDRR